MYSQALEEDKFEKIRKTEFERLDGQVYFDHAGSCLYAKSHIQRYYQHLAGNIFGNPHSGNSCSERMSDIIHQTRLDVLKRFNVTTDDYEVIFTSGATESLRIIGDYFDWTLDSIFLYTDDNHTSVVGIREYVADKGADSYCVACNRSETLSDCKLVKSGKPMHCNGQPEKSAISLFAFPAQSNFSGAKYPLAWINQARNNSLPSVTSLQKCARHKWYVLCDAASFVSTSSLDLKKHDADFVTISFYKIFGFPTGLGALLVKKSSAEVLCRKKYFGGGSVSGWLASHDFHSPKAVLHDRFEDGSSNFLNILALKLGFDTFATLGLTTDFIKSHTHNLWKKLFHSMKALTHENGNPLVEMYINRPNSVIDESLQGPILAFNIRRSDGSYIGYNHVLQLANSNNIYLRGGCFCNIGACAFHIGTENDVLLKAFENGHECGDSIDLIDGKPIGALRISLGPHSCDKDVEIFIKFMTTCFRESSKPDLAHINHDLHRDIKVSLDEIVLYPIKSCQGMFVKEWQICETGLKYDRMWMIVDEYGSPITLKKSPQLISIYPKLNLSKRTLTLMAEEMGDIHVPFIEDSEAGTSRHMALNPQCTSKVCGDTVVGFDCGSLVSLWLSEVLGVACSLIQKSFQSQRYTKKRLNKLANPYEISLVNEAQLLLINRSSVEYLYRKMVECGYLDSADGEEMLNNIVKRFRANLVVSGAPAFSEDSWDAISISSMNEQDVEGNRLTKCGLCNRCNVICIDPDTGQKLNGPLRALANVSIDGSTVRRKPTFGIYLKCGRSSSSLRVQSEIFIQSRSFDNS